jgi:hypothetical protein
MQCRYCASEQSDYKKKILSLRKALKGIQAEFWMFNYSESFERVAWPSIASLDSEGNITGFTATQCVLYRHVKTGWRVLIHPCFETGH